MRRWLALLLVVAGCASEQPAPVVPPRLPSRSAAGSALPVVAMRWEDQPVLPEDASAKPDGAPISLTAGDGTGLAITSLSATAVIEDPLAFTELHFVFKNPAPRMVEGRFEITLPPDATISRFAMLQANGWQEGEVVEREAAREAYEDFLHHRADPALLEKQAGNRFQARVFPIPASGEKEIIFSYSQELPRSSDPYRLYLHGLPRLGSLDLRVIYDKHENGGAPLGRRSFQIQKTDFIPDHDFTVALPRGSAEARGLRQDRLAVGRITPLTDAAPDPLNGGLFVLFDTSASRALGFRAAVERLGRLVDALRKDLGPTAPLVVACFDQDVELIHDGTASTFGQAQLDKILARRPLGASDLGKALRFAASFKPHAGAQPKRALLFTDGIVTAGEDGAKDLKAEAAELRKAGVERLDTIVDGGIRDAALLGNLTVGNLAKDGVVVDGGLATPQIAQRLTRMSVSGIKVEVPGSAWVWPPVLDGMQPGDQALIYADIPEDKPFEVRLGGPAAGVRRTIETRGVERPLLERAMVNAEIHRLSDERSRAKDDRARAKIQQEIVDLSTKYRVLSDFTGLLILETEEDYARFHIDRRALAEVLTIGPSGVTLLDRKQQVEPLQIAADAPAAKSTAQKAASDDVDGEADHGGSDKKRDEASAPPPPIGDRAAPPAPGGAPAAPPPASVPARPRPAPAPATAPLSTGTPVAPPRKPAEPAPVAGSSTPRSPPMDAPAERHAAAGPAREEPQAEAFAADDTGDPMVNSPSSPRSRARPPSRRTAQQIAADEEQQGAPPYEGKFAELMKLIDQKKAKEALSFALAWQQADPGDALALVALGEAYEALGQKTSAARAYGSIIDLFPSRADLRRFAGARLERLGTGPDGAFDLVIDTYRHAAQDRPDHPASHRNLAFALLRAGKLPEAFKAILAGASRGYPEGRFAGADRILREDLGLIAAAWIRAEPAKKQSILQQAAKAWAVIPKGPSLRFVLTWETDANDVDFHIIDREGGHAYYEARELWSGGSLYEDVTTGYGPECFTIEGKPRAYPYTLMAHYYSRGPMGYGMGKVEIIEHDGKGSLKFDERPFVVMTDQAFVKLGTVKGPLAGTQ